MYNYLSVNLLDFKVTLINDFANIFAPTIIFKIKNFKILGDLEDLMKVIVAFSLDTLYFNSENFHWEPFIEKTTLRIEFQTLLSPNGVTGKQIRVLNRED